jgi:hypothetical protein
MPKTMLCLVGEQPVPNILPIRHYRSSASLPEVPFRAFRGISDS